MTQASFKIYTQAPGPFQTMLLQHRNIQITGFDKCVMMNLHAISELLKTYIKTMTNL